MQFVNDLGPWMLGAVRARSRKRGESRSRLAKQVALGQTLAQHQSALLFLRRPPAHRPDLAQGRAHRASDLVRRAGRGAARERAAHPAGAADVHLGKDRGPTAAPAAGTSCSARWSGPAACARIFRFLLHYRDARAAHGRALRSEGLPRRQPRRCPTPRRPTRCATRCTRRMERERTLVVGPTKKTPHRLREEIMQAARACASTSTPSSRAPGAAESQVVAEVDKELRKLCATPDVYTIAHPAPAARSRLAQDLRRHRRRPGRAWHACARRPATAR